jgi:hypothetical protein
MTNAFSCFEGSVTIPESETAVGKFNDALKLDPENFFALKNENVDIGADLSTEYNAAVRLFSNQVDDL